MVTVSGIGMITPTEADVHEFLSGQNPNRIFFTHDSKPVFRLQQDLQTDFITHSEQKKHTRLSVMVIEAIYRCLNDAGLPVDALADTDTGIVTASYFGCLDTLDNISRSIYKNYHKNSVNPVDFAKATHSYPAAMAMIKYKLKGPVVSLVSSISAGLDALHLATSLIRAGKASNMIVVGYEELPALAEKYLVDTGIVSYTDTATVSTPVCEGCVALLLKKSNQHSQSADERHKPLVHKVLSNGFDLRDPTRCISEHITSACSNAQDNKHTYLISSGSEIGSAFWHECTALGEALENSNIANPINLQSRIGNYLGAAGLVEIGFTISAINSGHTQWLYSSYNCARDNTDDSIRFIFNSYDIKGNITSAVLTICAFN